MQTSLTLLTIGKSTRWVTSLLRSMQKFEDQNLEFMGWKNDPILLEGTTQIWWLRTSLVRRTILVRIYDNEHFL